MAAVIVIAGLLFPYCRQHRRNNSEDRSSPQRFAPLGASLWCCECVHIRVDIVA